ncbi:MAG: SRPBCC family protein [Burkholderiaceae bacterium]|nr:SRPBCC family protein [Burkholderiaceae bacterium]MDH5209265.1 SRPBCC family protein [Burkholderiaceae bacterium]
MLADPSVAAPVVDVRREGDVYVVHASGYVAADVRVAWDTLTDYEHLSQFVPDIDASRVVARHGNHLIVEHAGAFHLLFVSLPVRVRLAVEHEPYDRVLARTEPGKVGGDDQTLASLAAQYRLTRVPAAPEGVRVDYDARFRLVQVLPDIVDSVFGRAIVAHGLRRHFEAMLDEIERRQAVVTSTLGNR